MARLLALAVFLINLPKANALPELFDSSVMVFPDMAAAQETCSYSFGWGRSTVTITNSSGEQTNCTFSHTEKVFDGASLKNVMNSTYLHHYTCADGSNVIYSTTFFGTQLGVRHYVEGRESGIDCK